MNKQVTTSPRKGSTTRSWYTILSKMSSFHQKRERECICTETGKYDPYARKTDKQQTNKNHATETAWKSDQMLYLSKKDLKVAVINMFKEQKETIIKKVKKGVVGGSKIEIVTLSGML